MPYTNEEGGRLNNFANEPKMYEAQALTPNQKRNVALIGTGLIVLVSTLVYVAFSVS